MLTSFRIPPKREFSHTFQAQEEIFNSSTFRQPLEHQIFIGLWNALYENAESFLQNN